MSPILFFIVLFILIIVSSSFIIYYIKVRKQLNKQYEIDQKLILEEKELINNVSELKNEIAALSPEVGFQRATSKSLLEDITRKQLQEAQLNEAIEKMKLEIDETTPIIEGKRDEISCLVEEIVQQQTTQKLMQNQLEEFRINSQKEQEFITNQLEEFRANAQKERENISLELDNFRAQSKREQEIISTNLKELQDQAQATADAVYEKNYSLMETKLEQSAEKIAICFQEASQEYEDEYLMLMADLMENLEAELLEKKEQISEANIKLQDLESQVAAAVEINKRALEEKERENFYRIIIPKEDLEEIKQLRGLHLRNKEPINKIIWKYFYENPTSDMIGRVIGEETKIGIYKITNLVNQMCYVGQSNNIASRWKQHIKRGLGADTPTRNKLYPAMEEYGVENFSFEIIEECNESLLDEREQYWQNFYRAKEFGYSIK